MIRNKIGLVTSARERARELVQEALERGLEAEWHEIDADRKLTTRERILIKKQIFKLLRGCLLKVRGPVERR
jgi:hypothetical protein